MPISQGPKSKRKQDINESEKYNPFSLFKNNCYIVLLKFYSFGSWKYGEANDVLQIGKNINI
jgi:hypothetical protein